MIDTNEDLVKKIKRGEDKEKNLELLYYSNLPLIRNICKPYVKGDNMDDLLSCAFLGIVSAIPSYDRSKGAFFTYCKYHIRRECMEFLRMDEMPFVVPQYVNENLGKYKKAFSLLQQQLNREPTKKEIADYTGLSVAQIEDVQRVLSPTISLDSPCGEGNFGTIADFVSDDRSIEDEVTDSLNRSNQQISLWKYIEDELSDRQFEILRLRYIDGWSVLEIAEKYGISRQRVNQIERKAFQKLLKNNESAAFLAIEIESLGYDNYSGVGFRAFRRRWASSVEMAVLRREGKKGHFSNILREAECENKRFEWLVKGNDNLDC